MANANAKFFCESCGAEVPRNAKFCRTCGRFFSSVRCPNCGATGSPDTFVDGCPACGYTVSGGAPSRAPKEKKPSRAAKKHLRSAIDDKRPLFGETTSRADESLPFWMYIITGLSLLVILLLILRYFGK